MTNVEAAQRVFEKSLMNFKRPSAPRQELSPKSSFFYEFLEIGQGMLLSSKDLVSQQGRVESIIGKGYCQVIEKSEQYLLHLSFALDSANLSEKIIT